MPDKEPDRDALFVEIAMNLGYLESEQAEVCREDQRHFEKMGYSRSMMQIALEKGFIDQAKVVEIRREMQKRGVLPRIGGYELISKLGQGGMGAVYKARQLSLDRIVALKLLPPELARDKKYVERFRREGMIAAKITHPNAVQVIDVGESGGRHYMVMEYVDGFSAERPLQQGPMPEDQALEIIRGVLEALNVAHQSNIIHRDIKPSNILIDKQGRPKLADLGIARQSGIHGGTLTGTGAAIGTPHYMSPEQCQGESDLDARADIYSLGATLYHLCCGEPPYADVHPMAVMHHQMHEPLPDPRQKNPDISPGVAALIVKMMSKDRNDRPADCPAVLDEIKKVARLEAPKIGGDERQARVSVTAPPMPTGEAPSSPVATPAPAIRTIIAQNRILISIPLIAIATALLLLITLSFGRKPAGHDLGRTQNQSQLRARYNEKWSEMNLYETAGNWQETLAVLYELRLIGEHMDQKPSSFSTIDQRIDNARRMILIPADSPQAEAEPVAPVVTPSPATETELILTDWSFDSREARRRQEETAQRLGIPVEKTIDLGGGVTLEMVLIPAGEFMMGSPDDEDGRYDVESPQRRVRITHPFYIGKYPVTQAQWSQVLGATIAQQRDKANPYGPLYGEGRDNPMYYVSWKEAQGFIAQAANNLRLPTEAEWEYACRAGTTTRFYSGDSESDLAAVGWYSGNSGRRTHPVGQKTPNAWGLYDMHGNVWEWVSDWWQNHYRGLDTTDPQGPATGDKRVLRGGSWYYDPPNFCRSASRIWFSPDASSGYLGFRVVSPAILTSAEPAITSTATERETLAPVDGEELPQVDLPTAKVYTEWPFDSREAQRRQHETARRLGIPVEKTMDLGGGVTLEMVLIPAGEFMMGSPDDEDGRNTNEGPQRRVQITQPFYMGKYEVTQAQYERVMGTNPSGWKGASLPVEQVSWIDAQEFIGRAGNNLRLPTEAEWEYACRAGTSTRFYSSDRDNDLDGVGWYRSNSGGRTRPVGRKPPNAWGLYDMHGNVSEWVSDWFQDSYRGLETTDPQGPATGNRRVFRGSSFGFSPEICRSAARGRFAPGNPSFSRGFRVASPAIPTSAEPAVTPTAPERETPAPVDEEVLLPRRYIR